MAFRSEQQRKAVFASIGRGLQKAGRAGGRAMAGARYAFGTNQQMRDIRRQGGLKGRYAAAGGLGALALAGGALALGARSVFKSTAREQTIIRKMSNIRFAQGMADANRANARYSTMLSDLVRRSDRAAKHLPKLQAMLKGTRRKTTRTMVAAGTGYAAGLILPTRAAGAAQHRARSRRQ